MTPEVSEFNFAIAKLLSMMIQVAFIYFWHGHYHFKPCRNPYRRYCKHCGAQHDTYEDAWGDHWECMDEGCKICRRFAR